MTKKLNPNLAAEGILGQIPYPLYVSPKHNGVRMLNASGNAVTRSLEPIPNVWVRKTFSIPEVLAFDGEGVVGYYGDSRVFTNSTSGIMSHEGIPDFTWYVFDITSELAGGMPLDERVYLLSELVAAVKEGTGLPIEMVPYSIVNSDEELVRYHDQCLLLKYEGVVGRHPKRPYKNGRSTQKESGFLRFCDWLRSEAVILEVIEGTTNTNEKTVSKLGYAKRSTHKDNKVPTGKAGSARVRDIHSGIEFSMAIQSEEDMIWFWEHRFEVAGKIVKYKYRAPVKIAPRFPQYEGFRHAADMS